jgi:hypothetical protein
MTEVLEDSYTVLQFVDVDSGGKVYRGDELTHELGFSSLDGFEKALKEFKKNYQRIRFVAEDWEVMADLAFGKEWSQKSLSEIIAEAKTRGITVEVYPKTTES